MEIKATQKYLVSSPKKIREVAYMVKKLSPLEALERLPFVQKRSAKILGKVIQAAVANARNRGVEDDTTLVFKEIQVNEGPKLKRWRAGARGRAKPYKRKMSHIRVVLMTKEVKKPVKEVKAAVKADSKADETPNKNPKPKLLAKLRKVNK